MACKYEEEIYRKSGKMDACGCPTCPYKNLKDCKETSATSLKGRKGDVMEIGKRVAVNITDFNRFAAGCAESLDGKTGTVTELNNRNGMWLVEFDTPAKTWWSGQLPVPCFWLREYELI